MVDIAPWGSPSFVSGILLGLFLLGILTQSRWPVGGVRRG